MCFGGGGSPTPEPRQEVREETKQAKKEEEEVKIKNRQEALEKEVTSDTPIKTQLTYEMGAKAGTPVTRGRRGRRALYTSGRGGIGFRNPMMY